MHYNTLVLEKFHCQTRPTSCALTVSNMPKAVGGPWVRVINAKDAISHGVGMHLPLGTVRARVM
jgi:hypothetical protein